MKNTERVDFRLPSETKELLKSLALKKGLKPSEYIRRLIEQDANNISCRQQIHNPSHEQLIENALPINVFTNGLLNNPRLTLEARKIITKEMRNYVGY